jgi:AAA+ ATPase superfamily predicted ATPase
VIFVYILPQLGYLHQFRQNILYYILPKQYVLVYLWQNINIMKNLIGRKSEINELLSLYHSDRAEFVAVYGRRRVGKTYLINHALKGLISFQHTGVSPVSFEGERSRMKTQLESFYYSLLNYGLEGFKQPTTWMEAFYQLEQLLIKSDNGKRQVIFFDELPWMDTPKSGFLAAFENFWNGWCSSRDNIMLVVCGSATSWILGNLSRSKGGLYGRLTAEIKLSPFTLKECEEFFKHNGIEMSRYDIVQSYMTLGGIPYYLNYFQKGNSFEQNIDKLLFGSKPRLKDEFNRLFNAIFVNAEDCKKIIRLLATRHSGFTREEISKATGLPSGGGLTKSLAALAESDFIMRYIPYDCGKSEAHYKLIDNFCLFSLKYVEPNEQDASFMTDNATSDIMKAWRGIAFEEVCWQHINEIKRALEVGGVKANISAWRLKGDDNSTGIQIDLIIDRADNVVNLCEMKFASGEYQIDKDEELKLRKRIDTLKETLSAKKTVHLTMVSTYGIAYGKHTGIVQRSITIDDLFI